MGIFDYELIKSQQGKKGKEFTIQHLVKELEIIFERGSKT
jgi:hypothetical protein